MPTYVDNDALNLLIHLGSVAAILALGVWGLWVARPAHERQVRKEQDERAEEWRAVRGELAGKGLAPPTGEERWHHERP